MILRAAVAALFLLGGLLPGPAGAAPGRLKLATTTSTANSGLLAWLHPPFEEKHGVKVHVIAVGTGKALRLGQNGDVDVVLVHAREAEERFVAEGHGVGRREVMYNDFVIAGPPEDPAGVRGMRDAAGALRRIAGRGALWFSRGDDSGTHKKEEALWRAAGLVPRGPWFRLLGQGMGKTLIAAEEKRAYTLSDRGTFAAFAAKEKISLALLAEGDERLFNPYGVIAVNPARHPGVNHELAAKYVEFLVSPEGQRRIGAFRMNGRQLFHPSAGRAPGN